MSLTATCDKCGRTARVGGTGHAMYQVFIKDITTHNDVTEPKIVCQDCLSTLFDQPEEPKAPMRPETTEPEPFQPDPGREEDMPEFESERFRDADLDPVPDTFRPTPVASTGKDAYHGMQLRTFLNTDYYKNTVKAIEFRDENGVEIMNFRNKLDHRIINVRDTGDGISVTIRKP